MLCSFFTMIGQDSRCHLLKMDSLCSSNSLLMSIVLNLGILLLDFTVILRAIALISFAWHRFCGLQQLHSPFTVLLLDTKPTLKIWRLCFTCMYGVRIQLLHLWHLILLLVSTSLFLFTMQIMLGTFNVPFFISEISITTSLQLILFDIRVIKLIL